MSNKEEITHKVIRWYLDSHTQKVDGLPTYFGTIDVLLEKELGILESKLEVIEKNHIHDSSFKWITNKIIVIKWVEFNGYINIDVEFEINLQEETRKQKIASIIE